jgi:hypothetical protein
VLLPVLRVVGAVAQSLDSETAKVGQQRSGRYVYSDFFFLGLCGFPEGPGRRLLANSEERYWNFLVGGCRGNSDASQYPLSNLEDA